MDKYQDALEEVASETVDRHADGYYQPKTVEHFHSGAIDTLRELVEKATPQQVVEHQGMVCCPKCGRSVYMGVDRYCSVCGQAINNTTDFWRNGEYET